MGKPTPIGSVLAWPLLPPANIAYDALGLGEHQNRGDPQPLTNRTSAFWSFMLITGRYKGNPVVKHLAVPGLNPQPFERWLALFEATSREPFDEATSEAFRIKGEHIPENLKLALFCGRTGRGHRSRRHDVRRH